MTIADVAAVTPEPEAVKARAPAGAMYRDALRLWRTRIGLVLVVLLVGVAIVGPYFAPHGPTDFFGVPPNSPPSSKALFGTDYLGQDVWSRFLWGGRDILVMAVLSTAIGLVLGAAIGLTAALAARPLVSRMAAGAALDFTTAGATTAALLAVAMAAGWPPARRAARTDPTVALRSE